MDAVRENSTEKVLEQVSQEKPVSVYSVNFARVINNFADKNFIPKSKICADAPAARQTLSRKIFKLRHVAVVAAILAIGVLHFAFQMSFISVEIGKNRQAAEVPPVRVEPARVAPLKVTDSEFELKKTNAPLTQKSAPVIRKQAEPATAVKSQPRKKEAVESRAERLRRAERILTGV